MSIVALRVRFYEHNTQSLWEIGIHIFEHRSYARSHTHIVNGKRAIWQRETEPNWMRHGATVERNRWCSAAAAAAVLHWSWSNEYIDTITHRQCHWQSQSNSIRKIRSEQKKLNRFVCCLCILSCVCACRFSMRHNIRIKMDFAHAIIAVIRVTCHYAQFTNLNFKEASTSLNSNDFKMPSGKQLDVLPPFMLFSHFVCVHVQMSIRKMVVSVKEKRSRDQI